MRSQRIDVLRLAAIGLVIGNHLPAAPATMGPVQGAFFGAWRRGGWVGVDLFFVLSGFLVAGLLLDEHRQSGRIAPLRFLGRRAFKIYPGFWLLTATTFLAGLTFFPQPGLVGKTLRELLFVQNYGPGLWNHTWSLAVEEHFYLSLALLLWFLARRGTIDLLPWLVVALGVTALAFRCYTAWQLPYAHATHLFPTHLRIDSLFVGVGVAWAVHRRSHLVASLTRGRGPRLLVAGVAAFVPAFLLDRETAPFLHTIGYSLLAIGSALVLGVLLGGEAVGPSRGLRLPAWIGARSYSIYLWHMPVAVWLMPRLAYRFDKAGLTLSYPLYALGSMLGSIAVGILMAQLVELPLLRLRDRVLPSSRAG